MSKNILHYLFVFCTKYKKKLLIEELYPDFLNLTYKYCYENDLELVSLNIRDSHTVIIEIKTELSKESPHIIIANLKAFLFGELKKKYLYLTTKTPSLWTREVFVQTIGKTIETEIDDFIDSQQTLEVKAKPQAND
jgi:REP element-mobilizing transposase RayT